MGLIIIPEPSDYLGKPINSRQGQPFKEFNRIGFTAIKVLPELNGRKWDELALGLVHALRPSQLRVVRGSTQMDAETWRVTVWLKDDDTIDYIEQEVEVGLPDGVKHGYGFECALRGESDPTPDDDSPFCLYFIEKD